MFNGIKNILVLAPHTDDGELGCGGTIVKFIEDGVEVHYAAFSTAEESVPEGLPKDILKIEVREAMASLGIPECPGVVEDLAKNTCSRKFSKRKI